MVKYFQEMVPIFSEESVDRGDILLGPRISCYTSCFFCASEDTLEATVTRFCTVIAWSIFDVRGSNDPFQRTLFATGSIKLLQLSDLLRDTTRLLNIRLDVNNDTLGQHSEFIRRTLRVLSES